jgi:SAM-dependent methyltransferase
MKNKHCPVCNGNKYKALFKVFKRHGRFVTNKGKRYLYLQCDRCKTLFLDVDGLGNNFFEELYLSEYYKRGTAVQTVFESFLTSLSNKIQSAILLSYCKNRKIRMAVLDIGCGEGNFLKGLNKNNFIRYGLDLKNNKSVDSFNEIQVYRGDFLTTKFKRKFDVIVLLHVLEHLRDPVKVLRKAETLLNPKGIIILSTPNTGSIGFRLGRQNWFHLDPPYHVVLFNENNMKLICKRIGLKVLGIKNDFYQFPLDLYWSLKGMRNKFLYYIFYPVMKVVSRECLTYVIVRK